MYPGNHVESGIVTVPTKLRTRKNAPTTHLAYITDKEADVLKKLKKGVPHKGPHGIPNYDSWDYDATTGRSSFTSGAESSAQEARARGDKSQDRRDTSYSTRDVRSSPDQREAFRIKTNQVSYDPKSGVRSKGKHYVETPSERIARIKAVLGRDTLNKPIFVTEDLSYDELDEIATEGERLLDYYETDEYGYQTLPGGEDWSSFFDPLEGLTDITGPTSKEWYQDEGAYPSGPGGPSGSYGYGYGNDIASYYGAGLSQNPKQLGAGEEAIPSTELLDYMIRVNKYNPYTKQAMAKDGGLLSLLR